MRYPLFLLSMLGLLATATQATAQHASREFWTENSAAAGSPVLASLGQSETAIAFADTTPDTTTPTTVVAIQVNTQFLLAHQDFAVTHNSEPMGAFRRKRKP